MTDFPTVALDSLPSVTAGQMREIDRLMGEDLEIDLARMMENAGANLAAFAIEFFRPLTACVLVGRGGNGGGGLTAARHLSNRGVHVTAVPSHGRGAFAPVPLEQLDILTRIGVEISSEPQPADLVIDALLGYSLRGAPRGRIAELIEWANHTQARILSLDVPSGLDATTGAVADPCVHATATLTLALPKTGLRSSEKHVGRLYLADISVPPSVYGQLGISVPNLFGTSRIVELTR